MPRPFVAAFLRLPAIERLGAPTSDTDRTRFTMAAKRIVQSYNATGRRKEGGDWKRKFDALLRPQ